MVKKIKQIKLNRPQKAMAANSDPTIGTQENPYTIEEFDWLVFTGEWTGGWVECYGYVPWNLEEWYDGDSFSTFSSFPFEDDDDDEPEEHEGNGSNKHNEDNNPNDNNENENQNGNNNGENNGGGNGDAGESVDNSNNNPISTQPKGWCLYNCIAYAIIKLYNTQVNVIQVVNTYVYGTNSWQGTQSKYDITYGPRLFDENNQIQTTITLFINFLFNASDWARDKSQIRELCIQAENDGSVVIAIIAQTDTNGIIQSGHAGIISYASKRKCNYSEADGISTTQEKSYSDFECAIKVAANN